MFVAFGDVHLQDFVGALLEVYGGLNGQIDALSEIGQILFGKILDAFFLGFLVKLFFIFLYFLQPSYVLFS
jgi:hypothetical protein